MRIALTIWKNRISPLFDATSRLLIVHIKKKEILAKRVEVFECPSIFLWVQKLDELRIQVLICGGLSAFSEYLIQARGIRVFSFVSGTIDEVLESFLAGSFKIKEKEIKIMRGKRNQINGQRGMGQGSGAGKGRGRGQGRGAGKGQGGGQGRGAGQGSGKGQGRCGGQGRGAGQSGPKQRGDVE
jgi:predicted Fe-Mo cluster-binding NifX family protein